MQHESHPEIARSLRQAYGQLAATMAMLEAARPCLDLAQQLQAVESIIHNAKRSLIQDHLQHCIADAAREGGERAAQAMADFKSLAKYL